MNDGAMFSMSFYANRAAANSNAMCPVEAALEPAGCTLACEPRAGSSLRHFELMLLEAQGAFEPGRRHHGCRLYLRAPGDAFRQAHYQRIGVRSMAAPISSLD
jgi:hypothetical protein